MKKVIGIVLIIVISLFILTGHISNAKVKERFEIIEEWGTGFGKLKNFTFYDKETNVQYYYIQRAGITVLVDADGKPLLYEGD